MNYALRNRGCQVVLWDSYTHSPLLSTRDTHSRACSSVQAEAWLYISCCARRPPGERTMISTVIFNPFVCVWASSAASRPAIRSARRRFVLPNHTLLSGGCQVNPPNFCNPAPTTHVRNHTFGFGWNVVVVIAAPLPLVRLEPHFVHVSSSGSVWASSALTPPRISGWGR